MMEQQTKGLITLPCGCVVREREGVRQRCERADELFKTIKKAQASGESRRVERSTFFYEEHFNEQLEALVAE